MRSMHSKKRSLMLFEAYCIFGYREFYKKLLCILVEVNNTMFGNNEGVPAKLLDIFLLSSPGIRNHMNQQVGAPDPVCPQSYRTILNKQEFIIHNSVTRPVQFNIPCPQCLQCQPFMTNLELDGIESILMITLKIISKQVKWVMWYNKKKIYNTTTV
jgi:hypothetical protein